MLLVIVGILFPIFLNFLLGIPAIPCVISNEEGWLSFWGSYSGALITGIISFVILYSTIKANIKQQNRQITYEENVALRKAIACRLPHLNYSRLLLIEEDLLGQFDINYERNRLDFMYSQVSDDFNSFSLVYRMKYPDFTKSYKQAVDGFLSKIREINTRLSQINNSLPEEFRKREIDGIISIILASVNTKNQFDNLWNLAEHLVKLSTMNACDILHEYKQL